MKMDPTIVYHVRGEGATVIATVKHVIEQAYHHCPEGFEVDQIVRSEVMPESVLRQDDRFVTIQSWETGAVVRATVKKGAQPYENMLLKETP